MRICITWSEKIRLNAANENWLRLTSRTKTPHRGLCGARNRKSRGPTHLTIPQTHCTKTSIHIPVHTIQKQQPNTQTYHCRQVESSGTSENHLLRRCCSLACPARIARPTKAVRYSCFLHYYGWGCVECRIAKDDGWYVTEKIELVAMMSLGSRVWRLMMMKVMIRR